MIYKSFKKVMTYMDCDDIITYEQKYILMEDVKMKR